MLVYGFSYCMFVVFLKIYFAQLFFFQGEKIHMFYWLDFSLDRFLFWHVQEAA